ncbi:MAG: 3'(2'),5'-bisphosphate nucleotidase CysQ [Sphingomonadaceae bacterium]|nr:3'(2'),5'-bisphosphate nucleotidase CysQ [Sphingomonadaceae bacterium]
MPAPDPLVEAVAAAASEAGALARKSWRGDFARWEKSPGNPVCDIDLSVNALLKARLQAIDPEAGFLSEEELDSEERLTRPRVWIIDPIDGTRDYIRGRPGWAVSVALVEQGRPIIGVLDAPARDEHWCAHAGHGAWRNGEAIRVSGREEFAGSRVPADTLPNADRDLVAVVKPNSIALRIAMVAGGEADLLATLRWGHEWDVAAAVAIALEAGATVSDALGGELAFNQPNPEAFGVVVATPALHAAAVERLRERARAGVGKR